MLLVCPVCKSEFNKKPSAIAKIKHQPCCSKNCNNILRKEWFKGEGNHQKGLKGKLNSSFKTDITIMKRGTQKYEFEYLPWHPFAESSGRIRRHRAEVERNFELFDSRYFILVQCDDKKGRLLLNPKYDVHHKNENTLDNNINNLEIKTRGDHTRIHNKHRKIVRDAKTGKIIGVIKSGELLEKPEVVNQQPIVEKDIKVSTQVQRLGGEEPTNNPPTSARHNSIGSLHLYELPCVFFPEIKSKYDDIV